MDRPVTTVALGFGDLTIAEEILSLFERDPAFRVVGAVRDESALSRLVRDAHPAAVVGSPELLVHAHGDGAVCLAVTQTESVETLRDSLRAGAAGFYVWPDDRARLAGDAARLARGRQDAERPRGAVVAVYGPRGGSGATFLATNLAAAAAKLDVSTCLVECDPFFADASAALGVPADGEARTIEDLLPVVDELSPEHVEEVLHRHPSGFSALLGPHGPGGGAAIRAEHLAAVIATVSAGHELVILHLPRALDPLALAALDAAARVLLVTTLDVLALRAARRALSFLEGLGLGERCELVLNRVQRSDVVPADAERVLGLPARAAIRADRSVPRAQDRGELVFGRSARTSRAIVRLARHLTEVAA